MCHPGPPFFFTFCFYFLRFFYTRPFYTRPFYTRPFYIRPFYIRPFYIRPFYLRPFYIRPRKAGLSAYLATPFIYFIRSESVDRIKVLSFSRAWEYRSMVLKNA
jgi:hypothetical protein